MQPHPDADRGTGRTTKIIRGMPKDCEVLFIVPHSAMRPMIRDLMVQEHGIEVLSRVRIFSMESSPSEVSGRRGVVVYDHTVMEYPWKERHNDFKRALDSIRR